MLLTKLKKLFYSLLAVRKLAMQCKEQGKTKDSKQKLWFGAIIFLGGICVITNLGCTVPYGDLDA